MHTEVSASKLWNVYRTVIDHTVCMGWLRPTSFFFFFFFFFFARADVLIYPTAWQGIPLLCKCDTLAACKIVNVQEGLNCFKGFGVFNS